MSDSKSSGDASTSPRKPDGAVRNLIEFIGAHPFSTGLLAILGIIGFVLSVVSFVYDREEAATTTDQVAQVGRDIDAVRTRVEAQCASPPCWNLKELAQFSTLGRPRELITSKLPLPFDREEGANLYRLDDCTVRIEFIDDAVAYFAVAVEKTSAPSSSTGTSVGTGVACEFDIEKLVLQDTPALPAYHQMTFKDVLEITTSLEAGDYVLDGGNMVTPYFNFFEEGAQFQSNRRLYFATRFEPLTNVGTSSIRRFVDAIAAIEQTNVDYRGNQRKGVCEARLNRVVADHLSNFRVTAVGLGTGQRSLDRSDGGPQMVCD